MELIVTTLNTLNMPGEGASTWSFSWPGRAQVENPALATAVKALPLSVRKTGKRAFAPHCRAGWSCQPPPFVFLACSMALLFSQRRLCWICFSKSDSYLISTSELGASIPCSQPHCHRLWCKKEFGFPEHGQRLHSSIQRGGVRRGFPHPLANACQTWAWPGRGLWCREKPRLHQAMPPPQDATDWDEDQPRACHDPLLFFPCSLCAGPAHRVRANNTPCVWGSTRM